MTNWKRSNNTKIQFHSQQQQKINQKARFARHVCFTFFSLKNFAVPFICHANVFYPKRKRKRHIVQRHALATQWLVPVSEWTMCVSVCGLCSSWRVRCIHAQMTMHFICDCDAIENESRTFVEPECKNASKLCAECFTFILRIDGRGSYMWVNWVGDRGCTWRVAHFPRTIWMILNKTKMKNSWTKVERWTYKVLYGEIDDTMERATEHATSIRTFYIFKSNHVYVTWVFLSLDHWNLNRMFRIPRNRLVATRYGFGYTQHNEDERRKKGWIYAYTFLER